MKRNEAFIVHACAEHHPNRIPFKGILGYADTATDAPPSGSLGHKVILESKAVKTALPSLVGMAVNFSPDFEHHDYRRKCGIITYARLFRKKILVEGYLFAKDFSDVVTRIKNSEKALGMSYEAYDAHVINMKEMIWRVNKLWFTGASILYVDNAADKKTSFELNG